MLPATLHGVRVITELYFVVTFAAFKVSVTLNLAQRSFKVIHFGTNRFMLCDFIWEVDSNFHFIFDRFGDIAGFVRPELIFPYPIPISAKIWECSFRNRSMMLESADRRNPRLISHDIILEELQLMWSQYPNVTDRRTDKQTTSTAIPRSA